MDTRATKRDDGVKLGEEELETLRQALAKQEERLRKQGAALDRERAEMGKERETERARIQAERDTLARECETEKTRLRSERSALERTREILNQEASRERPADHRTGRGQRLEQNDGPHAYEDSNIRELLSSFKDEIFRELNNLRRDVDKMRLHDPLLTPSDGQRQFESQPHAFLHEESSIESSQPPKVSFREATECIPSFDGYNIPLSQFIRACRRAKETVPPSSERNLTKILVNKLRGRAYYAVEDEPCDTITQLIDLLNGTFGSPNSIDQYRGELSMSYIQRNEHILDYISRVKDLRTAILDAERRTRGTLHHRTVAEIDALTARSFCDGLPLQYRLQMTSEHRENPFEAFSAAKSLAKREELDKQRYDPRNTYGSTLQRLPLTNLIQRPLAHSTPRRDEPPPRYRSEETRGNFGNPRNLNYPHVRNTRPPEPYRSRENRVNNNMPTDRYTNARPGKWCRYCKNAGHEIEECRKRDYNNSCVRPGNFSDPPRRADEPRAANPREQQRPIRAIETQSTEATEGESQS